MTQKINNKKIYTFPNFLSFSICNWYTHFIPSIGEQLEEASWEERTIDITKHDVIKDTQKFINKTFDLNLKVSQAQTQNWHVGTSSPLHVHDHNNREDCVYTSSIYLNDNFRGGEFYTQKDKIIPEPGLMLFFNGQKIKHGVKKVLKKDRKTIIIWWKG